MEGRQRIGGFKNPSFACTITKIANKPKWNVTYCEADADAKLDASQRQ